MEALSAQECAHAVSRMVKVFEHRRDLIVDGLNEIPGIRCTRPQGAFYAFPNVEGTGFGARTLADRLLSEAGVSALPCTACRVAGRGGSPTRHPPAAGQPARGTLPSQE